MNIYFLRNWETKHDSQSMNDESHFSAFSYQATWILHSHRQTKTHSSQALENLILISQYINSLHMLHEYEA